MVEGTRVTVGTTAVQLYAASGGTRARLLVTNRGTAPVFLGGDGTVTTANGYELTNGTSVTVEVESGDEVFAVAGTAGHRVDVLRT
jgi:hypothetical protein